MFNTPKHEDANLILHLYELRREDRMRKARAWFGGSFHCKTVEECERLLPPGSDENAYYRQVVTYWEMVASFLNSGILDRELFYKSGNELLFTWLRLEKVVPGLRESMKDPTHLIELEQAAVAQTEWRKSRSAEGYEAFRTRVQGG